MTLFHFACLFQQKNAKKFVLIPKNTNFAKLFAKQHPNGTLDERFSQWSAKPSRAVRLRQVPQNSLN